MPVIVIPRCNNPPQNAGNDAEYATTQGLCKIRANRPLTAWHAFVTDPYSPTCSRTIRTARARSSALYFLGMTPILPEPETMRHQTRADSVSMTTWPARSPASRTGSTACSPRSTPPWNGCWGRGCSTRQFWSCWLASVDPQPQRFGRADAQLVRDSLNRGPLRRIRRRGITHHPHRPLPQLRCISTRSSHNSPWLKSLLRSTAAIPRTTLRHGPGTPRRPRPHA